MRALLLAIALLAVPASAQNHNARYTLSGTTTETGISGTNGTAFSFWMNQQSGALDTAVLHTLSVWQTDGRPCQIEAGFWMAPDGFSMRAGDHRQTRRLDYEVYDTPAFEPDVILDCGTARGKRTVEAAFPTPEQDDDPTTATATLWGHHGAAAIHGIRVCTDGSSPAVRGVRALVSTLNENGNGQVLRQPSQADTFERSGCRTWEPAQRCPLGNVATRVRAYYDGYGADRTLVGLSLMCRAVDIEPLSGGNNRLTIQRRN